MANIDNDTFQKSADLSLWFKVRSGDPLTLTDVPEFIPLRWIYFRDNWQLIRQTLLDQATLTLDPDYYRATLDSLTDFINKQRLDTTDVNPFLGNDIYYKFYPVFDNIQVDQIDLSSEEEEIIAKKKIYVNNFSKNDFLLMKKVITSYRDTVSDSVGLGDTDYNHTYSRGDVSSQILPTLADMNLMLALQDQLTSINFVLANLFAVDTAIDPFALAKVNANNSEVDIGQYSSGFLVKLHFEESLEGLATRYFKDPNKWIDIAIANGLKEPYIDEIGEQLFLLTNGNGNQINIAALDANGNSNINKLYVNQFLYIQSNSIKFPSQRLISGMKEIPLSGEIVLTLSGDANLDQYLLADQSSIRIFKPNTINSSQFILIPSQTPLPGGRQDDIPWFQASSGADEKKTKIDLAIGDDGALQLTPNGDIALSYNLANAIQAIKLKFLTELGHNRFHPAYGILNIVGTQNISADDLRQLLIESISKQIQVDGRFDRVESIGIQQTTGNTGPMAFFVNLVVRLANSNTLIPISFSIVT